VQAMQDLMMFLYRHFPDPQMQEQAKETRVPPQLLPELSSIFVKSKVMNYGTRYIFTSSLIPSIRQPSTSLKSNSPNHSILSCTEHTLCLSWIRTIVSTSMSGPCKTRSTVIILSGFNRNMSLQFRNLNESGHFLIKLSCNTLNEK
jgi:hypothetical protein